MTPIILTIGAFDGFHKGHARLLDRAKELAAEDLTRQTEWGAVTFQPHPGVFMGALRGALFTPWERELIRRALGVPHLFALRFDQNLKKLSPQDFWEGLKDVFASNGFEIRGVVMGRDFRFGHDQAGTAETLEAICHEEGLAASIVDLLGRDGLRYSSTEVRSDLAEGKVRRAWDALDYPWFLWSRVGHGDRRGRKLGFPTANLALPKNKLLPAPGVYAVVAALSLEDGSVIWKPGALSLGDNPTFKKDNKIRAEVFLLDFEGRLYGADLLVLLLDRLRPMRPFPDASALAEQIAQDVSQCREIYGAETAAHPEPFAAFASAFKEMNRIEALDMAPFSPDIWKLDPGSSIYEVF